MDLHFTNAIATEDERSAVDSILGPPHSGWQGGERTERSGRHSEGGVALRGQRHLLLPVLHAVQSRVGWISPGALNYVCRRLTVPPAEAYGVASFYALFSTEPQPPTVVHVCDDIACKTQGADSLCAALEQKFGPVGKPGPDGRTTWKRSPCLGLCEKGPAAFCQMAGKDPSSASLAPIDADGVLSLLRGEQCAQRTIGDSVPQVGKTGLELLTRLGRASPESLEAFLAHDGYSALKQAFEIGSVAVIKEVTDANLTGRGGAAFPTGIKWKAVADAPAQPHYVVCNADESEPGTFKDRVLMEEDPFSVIEALTIAGFACGAEKGYIYIRGEYPEATASLQLAIDKAITAGFLGDDILGNGVRFNIEIRRGAGAYICGEETALLESIEGKRGEPRNKPPFPVTVGLFGKPTAINNVETLANVLPILKDGGASYAATGTNGSTGTRLFCLSGCIEKPGVYEVAYGATLAALVEMAGGVRAGRMIQAILLGGAAGVFVRGDEMEILLTNEGTRAANATLGSGVVMVFDDTIDLKPILIRISQFFRDESCGQCVPCRVGAVRQVEALTRLISANGSQDKEIAMLAELDMVMKDASICGLGQTAGSAIASAIHRLGVFAGESQ